MILILWWFQSLGFVPKTDGLTILAVELDLMGEVGAVTADYHDDFRWAEGIRSLIPERGVPWAAGGKRWGVVRCCVDCKDIHPVICGENRSETVSSEGEVGRGVFVWAGGYNPGLSSSPNSEAVILRGCRLSLSHQTQTQPLLFFSRSSVCFFSYLWPVGEKPDTILKQLYCPSANYEMTPRQAMYPCTGWQAPNFSHIRPLWLGTLG